MQLSYIDEGLRATAPSTRAATRCRPIERRPAARGARQLGQGGGPYEGTPLGRARSACAMLAARLAWRAATRARGHVYMLCARSGSTRLRAWARGVCACQRDVACVYEFGGVAILDFCLGRDSSETM
eukprot:594241-Prymnesium_polylepis.1